MNRKCCDHNKSKFPPVTHVIFDLDGTLVDSEIVYNEGLQKAVESYGKTYPTNFLRSYSGVTQHEVAALCVEHFNIDTTVEEFFQVFDDFVNKKLDDLDLMPGAEKLVRHLYDNKVPIAIATSSRQPAFEQKTRKFADLFSLFSHVVCGESDPEVTHSKPAPDIFLICASRFCDPPDPSKCLVFEDSGNGIKSALAAGMQVVMTPHESVPYEIWKLATLRIDTFEYMMPQLFGLPPFPPIEEPIFPQKFESFSEEPIKGNAPEPENSFPQNFSEDANESDIKDDEPEPAE